MTGTLTSLGANLSVRPTILSDPLLRIGIAIGFAPVLAGLIFRTYGYHVAPAWAEGLRQLDAPFILIEIAVIMWARHDGLNYRAVFGALDRPVQIALLIFLGSFWVSSAFISENPAYSMVRASFWFVHIAFGFAVFHLAGTPTRTGLLRCGAALFAGFVMFMPLTALHLVSAPDPSLVRESKIIWSSAIPGCLSVRHLGIWSGLVLAAAIGALYVRDTELGQRRIVCAVILAATAALFWSGTRAGTYGIAGALVVLMIAVRALPPLRVIVLASAAAMTGVLISELWLPPDPAFGIFSRAALQAGGDLEGLSSGRTALWASMMQAFAGSPLFGLGEGAVHWVAASGGEHHVQPHNSVVQMLSSWGLVACLPAAYLLTRLLLLVHRLARREVLVIPIVLMIDCLLIMSLADGVLYFSRFIMWFIAAAAIGLAIALRGVAADDASPSPLPLGPSAPAR